MTKHFMYIFNVLDISFNLFNDVLKMLKTYLTRLKTSVSLKCMNEFLNMVDSTKKKCKSGNIKFVLIVSLVILNLC
jgi:hypothetical protein